MATSITSKIGIPLLWHMAYGEARHDISKFHRHHESCLKRIRNCSDLPNSLKEDITFETSFIRITLNRSSRKIDGVFLSGKNRNRPLSSLNFTEVNDAVDISPNTESTEILKAYFFILGCRSVASQSNLTA